MRPKWTRPQERDSARCPRVRRKLNTYSIRLVDGGSAEGRPGLGGGMERAGLGRSGGANSRPFVGKSAKTVSFRFILSCLLAGSAGCVQHIETLARRNWSGKLQSVTEMRQVGGGGARCRFFSPIPSASSGQALTLTNQRGRGSWVAGSVPHRGENSTGVRRN